MNIIGNSNNNLIKFPLQSNNNCDNADPSLSIINSSKQNYTLAVTNTIALPPGNYSVCQDNVLVPQLQLFVSGRNFNLLLLLFFNCLIFQFCFFFF